MGCACAARRDRTDWGTRQPGGVPDSGNRSARARFARRAVASHPCRVAPIDTEFARDRRGRGARSRQRIGGRPATPARGETLRHLEREVVFEFNLVSKIDVGIEVEIELAAGEGDGDPGPAKATGERLVVV